MKLNELCTLNEAHKTDEELFRFAHDATPYKVVTTRLKHSGQIGLDFGDSPGSFPIIYFPGGESGYYNPADLQEVSHEEFFNSWGVDQEENEEVDLRHAGEEEYKARKSIEVSMLFQQGKLQRDAAVAELNKLGITDPEEIEAFLTHDYTE